MFINCKNVLKKYLKDEVKFFVDGTDLKEEEEVTRENIIYYLSIIVISYKLLFEKIIF